MAIPSKEYEDEVSMFVICSCLLWGKSRSLGANLVSLRDKSGLVIFREKSICRENLSVVINASVIWFTGLM